MPDQTLDRIQLWRHFAQCVLREERARVALEATMQTGLFAEVLRAEAALDAAGACLNAAILALDEDLRPGVAAPIAAFPPALPVRTPNESR